MHENPQNQRKIPCHHHHSDWKVDEHIFHENKYVDQHLDIHLLDESVGGCDIRSHQIVGGYTDGRDVVIIYVLFVVVVMVVKYLQLHLQHHWHLNHLVN